MDTLVLWIYILVALGFYTVAQYNENAVVDSILWPYHLGVMIAEEYNG